MPGRDAPGPGRRLAITALAFSASGFLVLALMGSAGVTDRFDHWLLVALRSPLIPADPLGPAWLSRFFAGITQAGGFAILGLVSVLVAGFLALLRAWWQLAFVALSLLVGSNLAGLFKQIFNRARPEIVPHLAEEVSLGFPSGHATFAAIAYTSFAILLLPLLPSGPARGYLAGVAALFVLLIGFSRIWLGVHYPSDVLAGWCLGIAWVSGCWLSIEALRQR